MIFIYVIDLKEEAPLNRKSTVQIGGASQRTGHVGVAAPKGSYPFPLMSKGGRERVIRDMVTGGEMVTMGE
jgi:hypothetical protein